MDEEKKDETKEIIPSKNSNFTEKVRGNPWTVSTFILGILVIILLITTFSGTFSGAVTGNVVSKDKAAGNLISYLNANVDPSISLINATESAGLYLVNVGYQGQTIPVYMTKDGSHYTTTLVPMVIATDTNTNTNTQTTTVPKTEKPSVELYVFSYCPYGLQMEKAMIPVVKLLGDKIDFKIRQIGAMHGLFEEVEAKRQLCVEKNYPDKFLDYILAFADDTSCTTGADACVATKTASLFSQFGIDSNKVNACMTSEGKTLYDAEVANAGSHGVSGSPTLLINSVDSQISTRSPEAIKGAVCAAFSTVPTQCSQKLSTDSASAGFGSGTGASSAASCATPTA